jgi:hypothetical protein
MRARTLRRTALAALLIAAAATVSACQDTLVYGESTAFNLAIHLNDNPQTPIEVNAGLKRHVGEKAPPVATTEEDGVKAAVGEAVSSFSGFRLRYEEDETSVLLGDLYIRTQFATGKAATTLAGNPAEAVKVMDADFERDAAFLAEGAQDRVGNIVAAINALDDASAIALACNPPVKSGKMAELIAARDPQCRRASDGAAARQVLAMQASLDDRSEINLNEWESALNLP